MALGSGLGGQAAPPDFARAQRERGNEAVAPGDVLAVRVLVVERALLQLEDGDIGDGAGLQPAEPACPPDCLRGVRRHRAHDVGQRHAEAQEFAHRGRQVLGAAGRAAAGEIRRDRVGIEALGERRAHDREVHVHPPVGHVEDDAALARRTDLLGDLAVAVEDPVAAAVQEVAHDVAGTHQGQQLRERPRRVRAVQHHAAADGVGGPHGALERLQPRLADDLDLVAYLDAEDEVGVITRGADGRVHVGVREVVQLADLEVREPDRGDVEEREHPHPRARQHPFAHALEIARAGAAAVHPRRHARRARHVVGARAEVRRAREAVRVQVDEPGQDQPPGDVEHGVALGGEPRTHLGDEAVAHAHVERAGEAGVTHGLIRVAVGGWARPALARWHVAQPASDLLIGETPFVGHRLIELARPIDDAAEPLLASPATRFVIPVPSASLRRHLEAERARRASAPVHAREREDAPPDVLRGVWRELVGVARALGISDAADDAAYDPAIYRSLYERLLTHRHAQALAIDERLPAGGVSAYEFRIPTADLVPSDADVARFIAEAEKRYPDPTALGREIEGWFAL